MTTSEKRDVRLATILLGVRCAIGRRYLSHPLTIREKRFLRKFSDYIDTAEQASRIVPYPVWLAPQYWEQVRHLRCLETIPDDNPRLLITNLRNLVQKIELGELDKQYADRYMTILSSAATELMKDRRADDGYED